MTRIFVARQLSGAVSFDLLAADLEMAAMFALTAPVLKGAFAASHLQFVVGATVSSNPSRCLPMLSSLVLQNIPSTPCPWIAGELSPEACHACLSAEKRRDIAPYTMEFLGLEVNARTMMVAVAQLLGTIRNAAYYVAP